MKTFETWFNGEMGHIPNELCLPLDVAANFKLWARKAFVAGMDEAPSLLASATDLLNSWAREMAVKEAHDESDIKGVIDRLWTELSTEMSRSAQKGALLRQMLKETPNTSVKRVLDAIEGK
jgi:hypothetical protein